MSLYQCSRHPHFIFIGKNFESKIFNSAVGVFPLSEFDYDAQNSTLQDRWSLAYYMCEDGTTVR